jgi:hypothetical protein
MAKKQEGIHWKDMGKHLLIVAGVILAIFLFYKIKEERVARNPNANAGEKYFPAAQKFNARITVQVMVTGIPSQALSAYVTNAPDDIKPEFCSVLIGASGTSGCTFVFDAKAHEGDEVTIAVYQMVKFAKVKNRRIFYRRYTLSQQLPVGNDKKPDANDKVKVEIKILPPFPEKQKS